MLLFYSLYSLVEEDIPEEELYQYTRHRWLYGTFYFLIPTEILTTARCNEHEYIAKRYRKFNVTALVDAAVGAAGNSAKFCKALFSLSPRDMFSKPHKFRANANVFINLGVKLLKCTEGQYNKVFLITMDNGAEVVAKIPNPNAGPAFYMTASEVATRHFVSGI